MCVCVKESKSPRVSDVTSVCEKSVFGKKEERALSGWRKSERERERERDRGRDRGSLCVCPVKSGM